ncbi:hypothetical protein EON73_04710 [bacterium]|nr:MAG: hypothetical protein EON73_04710 [bacterium]
MFTKNPILVFSIEKLEFNMSIQSQYGLSFNKTMNSNGDLIPFVSQINRIGYNSVLTLISLINIQECQSFIRDLDRCINEKGNIDEGFFSDSVENRTILYNYPNVIIDDLFTIPMVDLKHLLGEWLSFINSIN